ncbi:MAG: OmpA family protein [Myxococcota bacterium]
MKKLIVVLATLSTACATQKVAEREPQDPIDGRYVARAAAIDEMMRNFARVQFEFDSALITQETRDVLAANVDIMRKFEEIELEIEGHCDEIGSTEYNLALGERRAEALKKYMVTASIASERIKTISYGEEAPISTGAGDTSNRLNRRAEFRVTFDPGRHAFGSVGTTLAGQAVSEDTIALY